MLQKLVALLVIRPLLPVNAPDSWQEVDLCTVVFASTYVACWPAIVLQTCTTSGLSFKADEQVRRTSHLDPSVRDHSRTAHQLLGINQMRKTQACTA